MTPTIIISLYGLFFCKRIPQLQMGFERIRTNWNKTWLPQLEFSRNSKKSVLEPVILLSARFPWTLDRYLSVAGYYTVAFTFRNFAKYFRTLPWIWNFLSHKGHHHGPIGSFAGKRCGIGEKNLHANVDGEWFAKTPSKPLSRVSIRQRKHFFFFNVEAFFLRISVRIVTVE